jgi:hypothetical protein
MSDISKLSKDEMINYLYVRDMIRGNNQENIFHISYIDMMGYALPFLLLIITFLVFVLIYRNDTNKKEENS